MAWHKIEANRAVMLEPQWIFRTQNAPVCSLKRDKDVPLGWQASMLNRSGISCVVVEMRGHVLEEAQRECEAQLREMGWDG